MLTAKTKSYIIPTDMSKTLRIRLFQSIAGLNFSYGKGEQDMPEEQARQFIREGIAELVEPAKHDTPKVAAKPHETAEHAISPAATHSEKRKK